MAEVKENKKSDGKTFLIIAIVAIILLAFIFVWRAGEVSEPEQIIENETVEDIILNETIEDKITLDTNVISNITYEDNFTEENVTINVTNSTI